MSEQRYIQEYITTLPGEMQIVHIAPLLHNIFLYMYGYTVCRAYMRRTLCDLPLYPPSLPPPPPPCLDNGVPKSGRGVHFCGPPKVVPPPPDHFGEKWSPPRTTFYSGRDSRLRFSHVLSDSFSAKRFVFCSALSDSFSAKRFAFSAQRFVLR